MADNAIFVLYDSNTNTALMENRPDLMPGTTTYWVYPGGKVEDGESAEGAMRRECREEIGCEAIVYQLLTTDQLMTKPPPGTKQFAKAPEGWRAIPFVVTKWNGDIPVQTLDDNHAETKWIDPEVIAQEPPSFTSNVAIAKRLIQWRNTHIQWR